MNQILRNWGLIVASFILGLAVAVSVGAEEHNVRSDCSVLYFQSENCQPCRQLEALLEPYGRQGWDIRKVDAPKQLELAHHFQIQNLPTLVFLSGNREIDRIVGFVSERQLGERLNRFAARTHSVKTSEAVSQGSPVSGLVAMNPNRPQAAPQVSTQPVSHATSPTGTSAEAGSLVVRGQSPAAVATGFPMLASVTPKQSVDTAIARAMDASVRIKVEESDTTAFGSGTIIATHQNEALVLTCGHLFRGMLPGSHLKVDLFAGTPRQTTVLAQLIDFKAEKEDIGLLSLQLPVAIEPVPVLPQSESLRVGQSVFSIGCDHGNNPSRRDTRITHVNRYLGPPNVEIEGAPAVGRSGGGLFDESGRLIGVCNAACNEDNEGIYASADVIYQQLARVDHQHLFATDIKWPDEKSPEMTENLIAQSGSTTGRSPAPQATVPASHTQPASLTQPAGVQLICVVRVPGASDRVLTIDQAPQSLLSEIEQHSATTR